MGECRHKTDYRFLVGINNFICCTRYICTPNHPIVNRINELFHSKQENILSIYFTAGYPNLESTLTILESLQQSGVDLVEIGIPYSDPVADGPTIQHSNSVAIKNGMTIKCLFEQLEDMRSKVKIPIVLMGYLNPIMQFGVQTFGEKCKEVGVDGLIIPDLPMPEYLAVYKSTFEENGLKNIFLITPQTSKSRILEIDKNSDAFIYMVSSSSITGAKDSIEDEQENYFRRINKMHLNNPRLIGFGIGNSETFHRACNHANGAIVGSAFIKMLSGSTSPSQEITEFIKSLRG